MRNILVTGGTVFVSRYMAEYYVNQGDRVYVLNRNTRPQSANTILIEADRHALGDKLKEYKFDVVIDVTAYNAADTTSLCNALGDFDEYIMISSSAVYPESNVQPFTEEQQLGVNKFWGNYGADKIAAEKELHCLVPNAYILRPPYLYGQMNNVYREAFVFDCAMKKRKFYLPENGEMKLQFFHVEDLCRLIDAILEKKPEQKIFNVGNPDTVTIKEWVELCYEAAGVPCEMVNVFEEIKQREYFSFYNYEYRLDVTKQQQLLPKVKSLKEGLSQSYHWYKVNTDKVVKKPYMDFIDKRWGNS